MFFWDSLTFRIIQWMLAIWSLPFLNPTCTSESSKFTYCWRLALRILSKKITRMWNECNIMVVWTIFCIALIWDWTSLVAQMVKHLPAVQETRVWSLGWEDPLEKEMATHASTLAWKIPWTEEPGGLQVHGVAKSWTRLSDFTSLYRLSMNRIVHAQIS